MTRSHATAMMRGIRFSSLPNLTPRGNLFNSRSLSTLPKSKSNRIWATTKLSILAVPLLVVGGGGAYYFSQDARERRKIRNTYSGFTRFFRTVATGAMIGVDYKYHLYGLEEDSPAYDEAIAKCHTRSAERILQACLRNGGLYIKMGQAISAGGQANFVPREFATTLQVLQDKVLTWRPTELDDLFLEDFGGTPEKFFTKLDRTPIASASLAQVFRATTVDGEDVAVKCQYIDLRDRYGGDLRSVGLVLEVLHWVFPVFLGNYIFGEIKETMAMELDFVNEGKNSERCARDLKNLPYLHVPKVRWDLTSPRVLTTEFVDNAAKVTDVQAIKAMGLSISDVNKKLLTIFGEQIFRSGFVHADPHPGNILIRKTPKGQAEIVLLDHGLYETIPENARVNICHIYKATVLGDHTNMKKYSDNLGMPDYLMFAQMLVQRPLAVSDIGRRLIGMKKDLSREDLKEFQKTFDDKIQTAVATVKAMPKSLFLVLRNMNLVRSICVVHGNPIDRYTVFSRIAARAAATDSEVIGKANIVGRTASAVDHVVFEWHLFLHYVKMRVFMLFFSIFQFFGWVPSFNGGMPGANGIKAKKPV